MVRPVVKAALADMVLLVALAFVLQDLDWRAYYAGTAHAGVSGYSPSFSLSLFTRFFTMSGSGVSLTSPPILDWVQILVLGLILVNGWFIYAVLRSRKPSSPSGQS